MAKLEGVKVIDMQGGEITKIAYGGEVYTKVENETNPVDGDIALNKIGTSSYTEGAFYELREGLTSYGSFGTKSDDQNSKNNGKPKNHFDVFRKVSAPTITERVDDLETRVSALEAEESLVGKYVVFHDRKETATVGKYYEITGILEHGGVIYAEYTLEDGEEGNVVYPPSESVFDYEIHDEKPAEKTSIKVGDYAKVIGDTYYNDIKEGTIVKITENADYVGDYEITLLDDSNIDYVKPEALEKIELSEDDLVFIDNGREPGEYKKGDVVRVIDSPNALPIGTIFEVSKVFGGVVYDSSRCNYVYMLPENQLVPVAFVESRVDDDA